MPAAHISYFVILAIFWGGSFLGIHYVVEALPPAFGAFCRVFVAFAAVSVLMLTRPASRTPVRIRLQAVCVGVLNMGLSWLLLFYGEKFINPALASIYNSTSTIFATLFAPLVLAHTHLNRRNIAGVFVGFSGILVVFGPHVHADDILQIRAQLAIIGMAVCYGLGVTWLKRLSHEIRATRSLFYQSIGAMSVLASYSLCFEAPWKIEFAAVPYQAWAGILYLAICSTFIAWLMFIRLIRDRGPVQASSVTYVMPVVSILLDAIFLGKLVGPTDMAGAGIILLGVYMIQKNGRPSLRSAVNAI